MKTIRLFLFLLLSITLFRAPILYAQKVDSIKRDTLKGKEKLDFVSKMQAFAKKSAISSASEFDADKAALAQNRIFEEIKHTIHKAKSYLKTGIDTAEVKKGIAMTQRDMEIAGDGVLKNKGNAQTFRNLTTTSKILAELLNKAKDRKIKLHNYQQDLNTFRYQMDSLLSLPVLFKFPTDSTVLSKYMNQIVVVAYQTSPIDSALKKSSNSIQELLNQANMQVFSLETNIEEIELYQRNMAANIFKREFNNIWDKNEYYRPFSEILSQAKNKGLLNLSFFLQNNSGRAFILILLVLTSFVYLRSLKSIYQKNDLLVKGFDGQLVLRYPLASALLIVISLFQFLFFSPPFILNLILWLISGISLSIMFKGYITRYWMNIWLTMFALFIISAFDNLILQASRSERWFMLLLAVVGTLTGILVLIRGPKDELREKLILISIRLMIILEFSSIIANMLGRYNLSKALLISGYLSVVIAILFLWTIRLINEGLFLAFNVYTKQDLKLFYLNFDKVGKKAPTLFYLLLILGWVILLGRNFVGFDYIAEPLNLFFSRDRTIGNYTFSINSLLLFITIMGIAMIVSKIVSYFAADRHLTSGKDDKQTSHGLGSWLLLVRITILAIGLFLALAAAGISLDKIVIVLGALGVGIGFGLQTLVNNLVSGLIIAFEKPVNVGDVIEVDGQSGTMKSIGFRSSVISTWDGADVVMPNGDLLNSHLTNWSLGGSRRRMSIVIGLAYNADLEKGKDLIVNLLENEPRVLKNPEPLVQYDQFSESSIGMKIFFWTKNLKDSATVKSDLIIQINTILTANGIAIPFPQQDVYIHQVNNLDTNKDNPQ